MSEFTILNNNLEQYLRRVQERAKKCPFGLPLDIEHLSEMDELNRLGYVSYKTIQAPGRQMKRADLTYNGEHYFDLKKEYLDKQRQQKIWEWVRYGITTLIALAALAVSIIALLTK